MTFHPRTTTLSSCSGYTRDRKPPEEILLQKGIETKEKVKQLRNQQLREATPSFKPQINKNACKLSKKRQENVTPSPKPKNNRFALLYEDASFRQRKHDMSQLEPLEFRF